MYYVWLTKSPHFEQKIATPFLYSICTFKTTQTRTIHTQKGITQIHFVMYIYILYNNAEKGLPLFHSYTSHHCTVSYHHIVLNTKSPTPLFIYTQRTLIFRILHSWKTYNSCFTRRSIRQNRRASIFSFSQRWKTLFFLFTAERHLFLYFPTDDRYNLAFLHAITYVCIIIHHIFC